ncbi:D-alanyl-D-alanine carboxypeptidase family protein [Streptomyces sp. NPDC002209]|uniref:D-alanyl-D-alanine carboxypeptidase family protein n=1 Tax=Streptomyces sp. NPDC002209 TaxID=3364638 RepID=UPI0036D0778D
MVAIEEELVAGESPDKSVDEGASGAAMSSAERDPRLSVFRPREPESGTASASGSGSSSGEGKSRDPLREAVAAWVATTDAEADGSAGESAPGAGSSGRVDSEAAAEPAADSERTAVFRAPKPGTDASDAGSGSGSGSDADSGSDSDSDSGSGSGSGSGSASDSASASVDEPSDAEEPRSAPASAKGRTDAPASAAAKPASAGASAGKPGSDSASAGEPAADSERTAVFRAPKPGTASAPAGAKPAAAEASAAKPGSDDSAKDKPAQSARADSGSASAADKPAAAGKPADSERTAVFRAVKPGSAAASASASAKGGTEAADKQAAAEKPAQASADSERTAVFRAVKPGSGTGAPASGAEKPAGGDRSPAGGSASGDAKGAAPADAGDSERTAVFRAPKLDSASGAAKAPAAGKASDEPADSERTAVFRAPKVDSGSGAAKAAPATAGKPAEEQGDSERTAVFRAVKPDAKASPKASPKESPEASPKESPKASASASASAPAPEKPAAPRPVPPKAVGGERASTFVPLRKDGGTAAKPAASAPSAAQAQAPAPAAPKPVVSERSERTTQQPLPPKPPLDMLADLTNNPPPPPSPLRTAVRRVKIYAPLVALLVIILAVVQLVRPLPEPKLTMTAKSSYTFDGGNPVLPWPKEGQAHMAAAGLGTVGSFGEQKPIAIGSVAKTMTAYVILKNHPLKKGEKGPMIDVDKTAVDDGNKDSEGESTVNTLKAGDKISEYDALAAIMIPSANNVARLLARWDAGGDQEAFVKKMNDAAKELGMANTTYTDPSGLDATTVSTAEDQVKLGLKIVEMPELIAITKLPDWTDPSGKKWRNYNTLIPFNGALGIKTGSTTKAGGNLLFAAEKQVGKTNQLIVGAVLGQHGVPILDTAIAASKQVMLATQKMLVSAPVVKKGDVVGYVDDGLGGRTPVIATGDVAAVGWPSLTVTIKLAGGDGKLPQSAKAGTEIGVLTVGEGASQVKVPVALQSDLAAPGIGSKLTRVG